MHYKNGREAKEGDQVVGMMNDMAVGGTLMNVNAKSDTCNGNLVPQAAIYASPLVTIGDCLHVDDVLKED